MTGSILLILAHPALHRSRANAALTRAAAGVEGVTIHDLYERYPDYIIDTQAEQALLLDAGALVFQHPFYWYSVPGLLKEWIDLVLTHGFAYGDEGTALKAKPWLHALTAGGKDSSYGTAGYNRFTVEEMLRPLEATAWLCGADWRAPFVIHGSHLMSDRALADAARGYAGMLEALAAEHAPPLIAAED